MLVVVALWSAVPALACLTPAQQDDCCRQMMQPSGPCDMDASQGCCQVHGSENSLPLGRAALTNGPLTLTSIAIGAPLRAPALVLTLPRHAAGSVPTFSPPGASVLRI
jgi:hypothetical protein